MNYFPPDPKRSGKQSLARDLRDKEAPGLGEQMVEAMKGICPDFATMTIEWASGLSEDEVRSYCLKPDRFLRKPFTADRFVREVSAALAA